MTNGLMVVVTTNNYVLVYVFFYVLGVLMLIINLIVGSWSGALYDFASHAS